MKKLLSVLALAGTATAASITSTACGSPAAVDTFFEPEVTMPIVYLELNTTMTDEALNSYVKSFISVTFAKEYAGTKALVAVDTSEIKLDKSGYYSVGYTVRYGEVETMYEGFVSVVDRAVVKITEETKLLPFTPKIAMTELVDYFAGIKFETTGVDNDVIVKYDDSTVRYAVPGTHLVKFTTSTTKHPDDKSYFYREVIITEAETPNKTDFDKYFKYTNKGLSCHRDTTNEDLFPKHLMIPSKYTEDNGHVVDVTRKEAWGCDFKLPLRDGATLEAREAIKKVETIILQDGHTSFNDSFVSISGYNESNPNNYPMIKEFYLPETVVEMTGDSSLSGTNVETLVLPRSLKVLDTNALSNGVSAGAWQLKNLIVLSMPTSNVASKSFAAGMTGAWFEKWTSHTLSGKMVHFHVDYMMQTSKDAKANNQFVALYQFAKLTKRTKYMKPFTNYNKLIVQEKSKP